MIFCHRYKLVARSLATEASVYATPAVASLQEQLRTRPAAAIPGLKPAQQLRLLAGKFLVAQNSLAVEFGKLFERGEDVAGRLSCNGTRLRHAGADLAPPSADTTGRVATSTNPCWLEKVSDPPRD